MDYEIDLDNEIKSRKLLKEFMQYCYTHPEERFWQALRNFAGVGSIIADLDDTFYWKTRDGKKSSTTTETMV